MHAMACGLLATEMRLGMTGEERVVEWRGRQHIGTEDSLIDTIRLHQSCSACTALSSCSAQFSFQPNY